MTRYLLTTASYGYDFSPTAGVMLRLVDEKGTMQLAASLPKYAPVADVVKALRAAADAFDASINRAGM